MSQMEILQRLKDRSGGELVGGARTGNVGALKEFQDFMKKNPSLTRKQASEAYTIQKYGSLENKKKIMAEKAKARPKSARTAASKEASKDKKAHIKDEAEIRLKMEKLRLRGK